MNIYDSIIKPILTNEIIINWIAPIFTGLIVLLIPSIAVKLFKNKATLKKIDDTNSKIINTIRPFIIQRIDVDKNFISDIRLAIIKENKIKEKLIYNEIEIRNKILLDISDTRFLKENEKHDLINFTYKIFRGFSESQISTNIDYSDIEYQKTKKTTIVLYTFVLIISLIVMLIAYINNPSNVIIEDNPVIIISMILIIFSIFSLYTNMLGFSSLYSRQLRTFFSKTTNNIIDISENLFNNIKRGKNKK